MLTQMKILSQPRRTLDAHDSRRNQRADGARSVHLLLLRTENQVVLEIRSKQRLRPRSSVPFRCSACHEGKFVFALLNLLGTKSYQLLKV